MCAENLKILQFELELASMRRRINDLSNLRTHDTYQDLEELDRRVDELSCMILKIKKNSDQRAPKLANSSCQTTNFCKNFDSKQNISKHGDEEILESFENETLEEESSHQISIQKEIDHLLTHVLQDDLAITVQPKSGTHYQIKISSKSSGEVLSSFEANESMINRAHQDGVFLKFLTFFVANQGNSLEEKRNILNHSVNCCKRNK